MSSPLVSLYRNAHIQDKPQEACGIFACYSSHRRKDLPMILYYGLQALQHRGQESAGITIIEKTQQAHKTYKNMGLVVEALDQQSLSSLSGEAGIGHVRYSTVGDSSADNIQPISHNTSLGDCSIAHNGTISNAKELKELLEDANITFNSNSDTEIILQLITLKAKHGLHKAINKTVGLLHGSYSLVGLCDNKIVGVKDPCGIRPLCIGKLDEFSYVLASETCALDAVGAEYIRDVDAGEIVTIDHEGLHSYYYTENTMLAPCSFEQIYFSRPDSTLANTDIYSTRLLCGKLLYEQASIHADVVMGVPQSGIPSAIGYAEASGISYEMGILKNPFSNRSFIKPTQEMRQQEISIKLNVVSSVVKNKDVIVIDDSLIRGNTSKRLIAMLKHQGAKKVHFMSASPPVKYPCYFGIDIAERKELAAHKSNIETLAQEIGSDSLTFLSLEGLQQAFNHLPHCYGCFTGTYPTYAPREGV